MGNEKITIVMPCLNEAETIEKCIRKAKASLQAIAAEGRGIGEILIADNGSSDNSDEIAKNLGARVVYVKTKGYGSALRAGIEAAEGEYIIIGDADDSYDFSEIKIFVDKLDEGYDLVMGNRFAGGIEPGAMSFSHRFIGNPVLSGIGRLFFKTGVKDFHCGMRAFRKDSILRLGLCTTGMEFASEMVVKAVLFNLRITEVPIKLYPDGRNRKPHLRSIPDGWRHLKFLLIYSPKWLFLYPGLLMSCIGFVGMMILSVVSIKVGHVQFEMTTMFYFAMFLMIGIQIVMFSLFTTVYGRRIGQFPVTSKISEKLEIIMTRYSLPMSTFLVIIGACGIIVTFVLWSETGFGILTDNRLHRMAILFGTLFIIGVEFFFSGFFMNVLNMGKENEWV